MDDPTPTKVRTSFDTAFIILLLTAAAYLVAFNFDVGYLYYFGLPEILAEVSLRGLLLCAGAGVGLGFLLIVADAFVTVLPLNLAPIVWRKLMPLAAAIVMWALYAWLVGLSWKYSAAFSILPLYFICAEMLLPLFTHREQPTYEDKLLAVMESRKLKDRSLLARMRRSNLDILSRHVWVLFVFLVVIAFAPTLGLYIARTQEVFAVRPGPDSCLVLRVRQDGMLCATVDLRRHVVTGSFEFLTSIGTKIQMVDTGRINEFNIKSASSESPARLSPIKPEAINPKP